MEADEFGVGDSRGWGSARLEKIEWLLLGCCYAHACPSGSTTAGARRHWGALGGGRLCCGLAPRPDVHWALTES